MSYKTREELTSLITQHEQTILALEYEKQNLQLMIDQMIIDDTAKNNVISNLNSVITKYYTIRDYAMENNVIEMIQFMEETDPSQIGN